MSDGPKVWTMNPVPVATAFVLTPDARQRMREHRDRIVVEPKLTCEGCGAVLNRRYCPACCAGGQSLGEEIIRRGREPELSAEVQRLDDEAVEARNLQAVLGDVRWYFDERCAIRPTPQEMLSRKKCKRPNCPGCGAFDRDAAELARVRELRDRVAEVIGR